MNPRDSDTDSSSAIDALPGSESAPPAVPRQPPLNIIEQGRIWLIEAYQRGDRDGDTFSTHDSQIDAVRAAKRKMDDDDHPCTLRWDGPDSVGNIYWNPLFECVEVHYDDLVDAWTVVPAEGTCAMAASDTFEDICEQAKHIQREYDFKTLHVYDGNTRRVDERDHRFIRYDITDAGVRFDPSQLDPRTTVAEQPSEDERTEDEDTDEPYVGPASPSRLGASIPDVTRVEFIDTDGILHRYATPWGDGTDAEILAISRKHSDDTRVREVFETWLSRWEYADDHPNVATVYESGTDPAQWVTHQAGESTLDSTGLSLPVSERLSILDHVADAVDTLETTGAGPVCGLHPKRIHLHNTGRGWRAAVAVWGIEWAVRRALAAAEPTPFTAPEQLDGVLEPTTSVYQLGALAYWLLCESPPFGTDGDLTAAIRAGRHRQVNLVDGVAAGASDVITRALATAPSDRYRSVTVFNRKLSNSV